MQDGPDLDFQVHLGDRLALQPVADEPSTSQHDMEPVEGTGQFLLTDEDRIALGHLAPDQVQEWCLSRIAAYQKHSRFLRECHDTTACNAISKNKSHIRALRTAYNDAAPIQRLPPEVLMIVFSHVHPAAVVPQSHVPLLRVCWSWRWLLFKTPQFWANLLSLPTWEAWNPKHHMGRFKAALALSAREPLALFVPYYSQVIVDILTPHGGRLSSFNAGPTLFSIEEIGHPRAKQRLHCITHYPFSLDELWHTSALTFDFSPFPNIRSLELEHTYFHTPTVRYLSLRHLKLDHCAVGPSSTAYDVPAMCAVHKALESFPNLETLSLTCCLSEEHPIIPGYILPVPPLTNAVHLPRLRHLELKDLSAHLSQLISHVIFPATTALALSPSYIGDHPWISTAVPLLPGFDPFGPSPHAELSLRLVFQAPHDDSDDPEEFVRWETHGGAGVRPVRVTLLGATFDVPTIARFIRALVAVLAPARGLTALTVVGPGASSVCGYWDALWPALGQGLRHLAFEADDESESDTHDLICQLEREKTGLGGAFACPVLETLALEWHLPPPVPGLDHCDGPDGDHDCDDWAVMRERDDGRDLGHRAVGLLPSFREFCDALRTCLSARAAWCSPLRELSVTALPQRRFDAKSHGVPEVLQRWQIALVEERMCERLGDLVEKIAVIGGVE